MKTPRILLALMLSLFVLTSACLIPGLSAPQPAPGDPAGTSAARTALAVQTQYVVETVRALMSVTPIPGSDTSGSQATSTLAPSSTPLTPTATVTPRPPTTTPLPPTPTEMPCNAARFVADVTVLDGAIMQPGKEFTKTWAMKNVGTCIWTEDFALVWDSGERMEAPDAVNIGKIVLPGQTTNISITLKTPDEPGAYKTFFKLRTDSGTAFGVGDSADNPFWVRINVVKKGSKPGEIMDLTKEYCNATWTTGNTDALACPSVESNNGGVFYIAKPLLEGKVQEDEPAIITIPSDGKKGFIQGTFPAVSVRAGYKFQAIIGCMAYSDDCTVTFELALTTDGTDYETLGTWVQKSDKKMTNVNIDLSSYAGKKVQMILKVSDNGDKTEDRAFWLRPRIVNN